MMLNAMEMRPKTSLTKPRPLWSLSNDANPVGTKQSLRHPTDVTFLADDYLVVADSEGHRLPIFDLHGRLRSVLAAGHVWPNGVACTREGHIVVTDRMKHLVKLYDVVTGQCVHAWGEKILVGEDEIDLLPHGVSVDSHGRIIVTETLKSMVKIYDTTGSRLAHFGGTGDCIHSLNIPFYVTVDVHDNIVISDNMNYSVKIFDYEGNFLHKIGSGQDWGKRQFHCPYGVIAGRRGHIVIADHDNNRLAAYEKDGTYVGEVFSRAENCRGPCGVAINQYGHLAFTENTNDYSNLRLLYVVDMHNPLTRQHHAVEDDNDVIPTS